MTQLTIIAVVLLGLLGLVSADLRFSNPTTGDCLCVTASRLNIRSGASTSNRIIATLNQGACYKYSGSKSHANRYTWFSIGYNGQTAWAAGNFLSIGAASQCGSNSGRYSGCTGNGSVNYQGKTLSDSDTRRKLEQIADYFCTGLIVTSGDRPGSTSFWHSRNRAADFKLSRFNLYDSTQALTQWNALKASGLFNDQGWEVIWHGTNTCTTATHLHIGRRGSNRSTCYKREGTTSSNICSYVCE